MGASHDISISKINSSLLVRTFDRDIIDVNDVVSAKSGAKKKNFHILRLELE